MWYKSENGNLNRPSAIDMESSRTVVYIRKDFRIVQERQDPDTGETIPAHYEWMECKIPKEDWEIYEKALGHDSALDDVYAALTELAELIIEG